MTYTKPEIAFLGDAFIVIESQISKTVHVVLEISGRYGPLPAYDLDE